MREREKGERQELLVGFHAHLHHNTSIADHRDGVKVAHPPDHVRILCVYVCGVCVIK